MISCGENRGCAEQRSFQLGKTSHGETPPSIHNPKLLCPHGWFPSLLCLFAQGYTLDSQIFLKATKKAALLLKPHLDLPVLLACCWYLFTAQPLKSRISPGSAESHLPVINGQSHSWYFNRINFHPCSAQLCWNNLWFSTFPWEGKCEDTVHCPKFSAADTQRFLLPCLQQSSLGRKYCRCPQLGTKQEV